MKRIITFGEIMMRLNPQGYGRFEQADSFEASYAGGEANVSVSLANYGVDSAFVTKLPAHEIGQCAVNALLTNPLEPALFSAAAAYAMDAADADIGAASIAAISIMHTTNFRKLRFILMHLRGIVLFYHICV